MKNQIEIYLKFVVDKGWASSTDEALRRLEQAGVKWNQTLGRWQETGGKKLILSWDQAVAKVNEYTKAVNSASAASQKVSSGPGPGGTLTTAQMAGPSTPQQISLAAGANVLANAQALGISTEEAAKWMEGYAGAAYLSAENLQTAAAEAAKINQLTERELMARIGISKVEQLNLDLGRAIAQSALASGGTLEGTAAQWAMNSDNAQETYEYILASARAAQRLRQESDNAGDALNKVAANTGRTARGMSQFMGGFVGFQLMMAGMGARRAGETLLSPIGKYTEFSGKSDAVSAEWLKNQREIEKSVVRIGRSLASELLPLMKTIAEYADKMADFVEANPAVAKALAMAGAGSIAIGSTLMVIGQIWAGIFAIKNALNFIAGSSLWKGLTSGAVGAGIKGLAGRAGGAVLGGAAALLASPVAMGVGAGLAVNEMLPESGKIAGVSYGRFDWGKAISIAAFYAGKAAEELGADLGTAEKWFLKVGEAVGELPDPLKETADASELLSEGMIDLFSQFKKAEDEAASQLKEDQVEAEEEYERERLEIISDYGKRMADAERQYAQERTQAIADFAKESRRILADFNRETAQLLEDFQTESARAYSDYQKARADLISSYQKEEQEASADFHKDMAEAHEDYLERLEEIERSHEETVEDLVAKRDALGLVAERRRYNREKAEAQDDYNDRVKELRQSFKEERLARREAFEERLNELQQEFAEEQARRQADFDIQMARREEEFAIEQERRQQDFNQKLTELAAQHSQEMQELQNNFNDELKQLRSNHIRKLNELQAEYNDERKQRADNLRVQMQELLNIETEGYNSMRAAAQQYVNDLLAEANRLNGGTGTVGTRQSGGYVSAGLWKLHDDEYVLNPSTTKKIENLLGGRMSQSTLLAALSSKRFSRSSQGFGPITLNQTIDFHGALTAAERNQFRQMAYLESQRGILEAIGAM